MNAWLLAGWTMLHFVWVGALVAALGAVVRLAVRRAGPNVRYAASLVMLGAVAFAPVVIAGVLASRPELMATWEAPALPVDALEGQEAREGRLAVAGDAPGSDLRRRFATVGESLRDSQSAAIDGPSETFVELKGLPEGDVAWSDSRRESATVGDSLRESNAAGSELATADAPGLVSGVDTAPGLKNRGLSMDVMRRVVGMLPVVWLMGAPVTFVLLAAGLVGSRRLARAGLPLVEGPVAEACARLRGALRVSRQVAVAAVEGLAQPVLVGIVRPTILLPAAALNGWTVAELEMVLVHELAHVRRWDNLVNLAQRVVEAALFFHPCVWLASRQVRRDREECCDAVVVEHTQAPEAYAELLINVASQLRSEPGRPRPGLRGETPRLACGMAEHALAGRLRRILKLQDEPMWVSRRMMGLLVVLMLGVSAAVYQVALAVPPVVVTGEGSEAQDAGADARYPVTYMTDNISMLDLVELLKVAAASDDLDVMWHDDKRSIVIAATRTVHAQLAALLKQSLAAQQPDPANADQLLLVTYPIGDVRSIDPVAWMRLTGVGKTEARWFEKNQTVVLSAPRAVHKKIAALLHESRIARQDDTPAQQVLRLNIDRIESQLQETDRTLKRLKNSDALLDGTPGPELEEAIASMAEHEWEMEGFRRDLSDVDQQIRDLSRDDSSDRSAAAYLELQARREQIVEAMRRHRPAAVKWARGAYANVPEEVKREAKQKNALVRKETEAARRQLEGDLIRRQIELKALGGTETNAELRVQFLRMKIDIVRSQLENSEHTLERARQTDAAIDGTLGQSLLDGTSGSVDPTVLSYLNASDEVKQEGKRKNSLIRKEAEASKLRLQGELALLQIELRALTAVRRGGDGVEATVGNPSPSPSLRGRGMSDETEGTSPLARSRVEADATSEATNSYPGADVVTGVGHQFPDGVDEHQAQMIVATLQRQGHRAEIRPGLNGKLDLFVRTADPDMKIEWFNVPGGAADSQWFCRLVGPEGRLAPKPLYDGKPFEWWRDQWRSELKVEKRMEAVEALAAFARAGYGREAAEALLDVAGEYDFSDGNGEYRTLKKNLVAKFSGDSPSIAHDIWLPLVVERVTKADSTKQDRWRGLLRSLLHTWEEKHDRPTEALLALATNEEVGVEDSALYALVRETPQFGDLGDPRLIELVRESLGGNEPNMVILRLLRFRYIEQVPELLQLLIHQDSRVQWLARRYLRADSSGDERPLPYDWLVKKAMDDGPLPERVAAMRGIAAMSNYLNRHRPKDLVSQLQTLLASTSEDELVMPIANVLISIGGLGGARNLIMEMENNGNVSLSEERKKALLSGEEALEKERQIVAGEQAPTGAVGVF